MHLALANKYYGHQNYRLHFAGEELQRRNANVISGGRNDLIDSSYLIACTLRRVEYSAEMAEIGLPS